MLALIAAGFVESRICGNEYYRITAAGWRELRKQRAAGE
jgi:DNA-binding PadR family transcriptional regulator